MRLFNNRRRRKFVNARVQGRILGRVAAYWMLYHIVLWHGLFVYRYAQARMSVMDGSTMSPIRSVYWQFCIDYSPLLICSALIMPLFMMDFLRLTHRVVGPLVHATDALKQLMDGRRLVDVEFRKGDLLTEFQATFNDFLAYYDQRNTAGPKPVTTQIATMTETQARAIASVLTAQQPQPVNPVAAGV